jgi:zinc transporter 1/2/3
LYHLLIIVKSKKNLIVVKEDKDDLKNDLKDDIFTELFEERVSLKEIKESTFRDLFKKENISVFLLLIALSIHSFFEGIALGVLNEEKEIFYMLLAIAFHKWVEAISIGINLSKSILDKELLLLLIIMFSLTTPLGIILGILLERTGRVVESIFLAFSAGTFLYISASEVIVEEFSVSRNKSQKFIGFVLGIILIALITLLEYFN